MKTLIFLIILILISFKTSSKNFYFSSLTGNDSYTSTQAQNIITPWKTINKLNSFFSSLEPGDSVLFKRGETFEGDLVISSSGTNGNFITIEAYGDKNRNKPIINGITTLAGWTDVGGGVFESTANTSFGNYLQILIIDGKLQEMGRFPKVTATNKGYLIIDSNTGTGSNPWAITSTGIPSSSNF